MFKNLFTFLTVLLIGLQIPLIVLFSGAQIVSTKIAALKMGITETEKVAKPVTAPLGFMGVANKVAAVVPAAVSGIGGGIYTILAQGQENVGEVQNLLNKIINSMYVSIATTILLIILLALLNMRLFFKNLGFSFMLGGILTLLNAVILYFFFILYFETTFTYLYSMARSGRFVLGLPFISSFVRLFAKNFIITIANVLIIRSIIVGAAILGIGILLVPVQRLFIRKR
ncbi:hypothetical protein E3J79_00805 [Candidatus Dependentiae bacterium]|nr:MAG: hypothetical protein E3J79_00805 [Candidatus Dependentiae bacterium]